jgi:hypothetical protein
MSDPAHILFPSDLPATSTPPDWFISQQSEAEARLTGRHAPKAPDPAGEDADPAEVLFGKDAMGFDDQAATEFFDTFAMSAFQDGDHDRADALRTAGAALVADAKAAGTNAADLSEALTIVRERQGDTMTGVVAPERLAEDFQTAMSGLMADGVQMSDIDAARAFIRDLDKVSPGTIATLNDTSAGNDPRLIRKAITEARRRGY